MDLLRLLRHVALWLKQEMNTAFWEDTTRKTLVQTGK